MPITPDSSTTTTGGGRRSVATFEDYAGAQRAVDALSDRGFPVERVAIVGTGLRYVEQVSGRLTTGRAALAGAGQGALVGLFVALLLGLFLTVEEAF
ncbi:MAG: glycine zipper family protein, partial [Actinobacteria bacterium]|nr:glycine zipper family protein [Actinomycetota bacterium]